MPAYKTITQLISEINASKRDAYLVPMKFQEPNILFVKDEISGNRFHFTFDKKIVRPTKHERNIFGQGTNTSF